MNTYEAIRDLSEEVFFDLIGSYHLITDWAHLNKLVKRENFEVTYMGNFLADNSLSYACFYAAPDAYSDPDDTRSLLLAIPT